jgi:hypothetical protein
MTTITLDDLVDELKSTAARHDGANVQQFEAALAAVARLNDPASIRALVPFLEDGTQFDEPMFSIIHTMEAFPDDVYTREVLAALPELSRRAPRWASIILMRMLNAEPTHAELVRQAKGAEPATKQTLRDVLDAVNRRGSTFLEKTASVLAAVS